MTSNLGSQHILDVADNAEQREARVMEALRGHFRPEFLNRIDEIIIFDRLNDEDLKQIVEIQLRAPGQTPRRSKSSRSTSPTPPSTTSPAKATTPSTAPAR